MAYLLSANFEWDDDENLIDQQKHGVSFEEARGLVVVIYTEREEDVTRIIGARLANKNEQSLYRSHMDQYR